MSKVFAITIAYAPAVAVARSLILYQRNRYNIPDRHIVALTKYPINTTKNENDIRLICDALGVEVMDLGSNIGSAQSQNAILSKIGIQDGDFWINVDPDSACLTPGWDAAMRLTLAANPDCILVSCMAPMVERYMKLRNQQFTRLGETVGVPSIPTPFNLSMWRYSFLKEIGGIPQGGLWWGEVEARMWQECQRRNKFHCYLLDYVENENGKFLQDRQQNEWKDLHMRTPPPNQFLGNFEEYLRWKYPELATLDTCKDLTNTNHP